MDAKTAKLDLGSVHSDLMQAGQGAGQGKGRPDCACAWCAYLMIGTNPSALTLDY